jgi:hypothetical protein
MPETIRPKALRGVSWISCSYADHCRAKPLCGRIDDKVVAAEVPVAADAQNLLQAQADLRDAMSEWGAVQESECTREDNYRQGEPVIVFRVSSYSVEKVY